MHSCKPLWWASLWDTFRRGFSLAGEQKKGSNGQQTVVRKYLAWRRPTFSNVPWAQKFHWQLRIKESFLFSLWYLWVCDAISIYAHGFYLHNSVFLAKILPCSHFFKLKESLARILRWKINIAHSSFPPKCLCGRSPAVLIADKYLQQKHNESLCTNLPNKAVKWHPLPCEWSIRQLML